MGKKKLATPAVAFLHIPKTGGTTLNSIIASHYAPDSKFEIMMRGMSLQIARSAFFPVRLWSFSKRLRLQAALRQASKPLLVRGHFDMSLSEILPPNTRYITLLRDPIERAISHYYHYRNQTADPIHKLAMISTLEQWVCSCSLVEMDNGQTRRLAGEMGLPFGRVSSRTLEKAKQNLLRFDAVGLTERFEGFQRLLQQRFRWPVLETERRNVSHDRVPREFLNREITQKIACRNEFDVALYQFAAELYERSIKEFGVPSRTEGYTPAYDRRLAFA